MGLMTGSLLWLYGDGCHAIRQRVSQAARAFGLAAVDGGACARHIQRSLLHQLTHSTVNLFTHSHIVLKIRLASIHCSGADG